MLRDFPEPNLVELETTPFNETFVSNVTTLLPGVERLHEIYDRALLDVADAEKEFESQHNVHIDLINSHTKSLIQISFIFRQLMASCQTTEEFTEVCKTTLDTILEHSVIEIEDLNTDEERLWLEEIAGKIASEMEAQKAMTEQFVGLDQDQRAEAVQLIMTPLDDNDHVSRSYYTAFVVGLSCPISNDPKLLSPIEVLRESVKNREMDAALLQLAATNVHIASSTPAIQEVLTLISAVTESAGMSSVDRGQLAKALSENMDRLPVAAMQEVHKLRNGTLKRLDDNIVKTVSRLRLPKVLKSVDELKVLLTSAYENYLYDIHAPIIETAQERSEVQKRKRLNNSKVREIEKKALDKEVKVEVDRSLRAVKFTSDGYVSFNGETATAQIDELINSYLKEHQDARLLESDLRAAISYIQKVDYAKGRVPGVKTYQYRIQLDGRPANILALKPSEASAIPSHSLVFRKTRILYSLGKDGDVVIILIADRDRLATWEKNNGLGSNRHG